MHFKWRWKRIIYTLCAFFFCLIDQRTKTASPLDGFDNTFRDLTGVGMAIIIMSHYQFSDFTKRKIPYLVWTALSVIGVPYALIWGKENFYFYHDWIVLVADVLLFGYIVIHTFISVFLDKERPKLNKPAGILWLAMMVVMVLSRSDYVWPLGYLIMFGCFYLTDYTKQENEDLFQGMLNGVILAFFVAQGYCCMFRPYDSLRYIGIYSNSNMNALFYLVVLGAVFAKILYVTRIDACRFWRFFYWLGAGVLYAFLFMTVGRTAWALSFLFGILFLIYLGKIQKKKAFIKNGMLLMLCAALMFPICFSMTRYIPPQFHHPVWFWGEWSKQKVHSWDPWDSEKYTDLDELLEMAVGRITEIVKKQTSCSPFVIRAIAAEIPKDAADTKKMPMYENTEGKNSLDFRKIIYQYYFKNLNLWGHQQKDQGFQLLPQYWIGHAHNIYLQYGTDFGIIMLLLFITFSYYGVVKMVRNFGVECKERSVGLLFFMLIPLIFGLLEYAWGAGSITITLLFLAWRDVITPNEKDVNH